VSEASDGRGGTKRPFAAKATLWREVNRNAKIFRAALLAAAAALPAGCTLGGLSDLTRGSGGTGAHDAGNPEGAAGDGSACTPETCSDLQATCGAVDDGCGHTLGCGSCAPPQTCGGTGVPNACGCKPKTCQELGAVCGAVDDGCGNLLSCGECPDGGTCGADQSNACGTGACTPITCDKAGKNCGNISDGCSGTVNCGACTAPETCGGGGTLNVCGCSPATCADEGKNCGAIGDGCGGVVNCGACHAPQTCVQNLCTG
jgi:hypothetical protein